MNDIALLAEYGPDAPPAGAGVLAAARMDLVAGIEHPRKVRTIRRPAISLALAGGVAVAVAIGLVATTAPNAPPLRPPAAGRPTTGQAQPVGITLVAFDGPVFPLAFRPAPAGTQAPLFSGSFSNGKPDMLAANYPAKDYDKAATVAVTSTLPDWMRPGRHTTFDGKPAMLHTDDAVVQLSWQRKPGQWVTVTTFNGGASEAHTRQLAATVVDQPQQISIQLRLAPAGWVLESFRDHDITLKNPDSNDRAQRLQVQLLPEGLTRNLGRVVNMAPVRRVTVNGRPGQVARNNATWILEGTLPGGGAFRLWAPTTLTESQLIAISAQVTAN